MRLAGRVACMGGGELHRGFWWENMWKREHLEVNIKLDLQEVGWHGPYLSDTGGLGGGRALVIAVMNFRIP